MTYNVYGGTLSLTQSILLIARQSTQLRCRLSEAISREAVKKLARCKRRNQLFVAARGAAIGALPGRKVKKNRIGAEFKGIVCTSLYAKCNASKMMMTKTGRQNIIQQ